MTKAKHNSVKPTTTSAAVLPTEEMLNTTDALNAEVTGTVGSTEMQHAEGSIAEMKEQLQNDGTDGTDGTAGAEVTGNVEAGDAPVAHDSPVSAPTSDMKSKLAGLLSKANEQKSTRAPQAAVAKAPRNSSTVFKHNSTPAVDGAGNPVRRFNSNVPVRQVVAIISESMKLAHITTD